MNDPIKDFVEQHRVDFDHLEAPRFDLAGFKAKQAREQVMKKQRVVSIRPAYWVAAAAILLVSAASLWFYNTTEPAQGPEQHLLVNKKTSDQQIIKKQAVKVATNAYQQIQLVDSKKAIKTKKHKLKKESLAIEPIDPMLDSALNDSTSSSTRLAAVLAIKRSDFISYELLNRLAITIQQDGNSNVRMAALSVLEKYQHDTQVSDLLIKALHQQNDPMVQLSLVNLLGKMKDIKIDDRLYALVNDPSTMEAVKDEAYQILLKENKF